ncbi:MAG: hypothetical protein U1E35_07000 [Rhodospirillales bacterium]
MGEQRVGRRGIAEPVVEVIAHRRFDQLRRLGETEKLLLGLPLELRLAQEQRQHHAGAGDDVLGQQLLGVAAADTLAVGLEAAGQRRPEAGALVGAACGVGTVLQ